MNINDFKSIINSYNGPARPNLFYVEIFGNNSEYIKNWELKAFCSNATLPGINFETVEYKPNNIGIGTHMPIGMNSEQVNCIFIMDSEHAVLKFFHQWMQKILNYNTSNGLFAGINNQLPYEINYKQEYSATIRITFFSSDNYADNYSVTLKGAHPTVIGNVELAWSDNDTLAHLPIQFTYEKIEFESEKVGSYEARYFNELSLGAILGRLSAAASGLSGTAESIQDIINDLYRVRTDYEYITSRY